MSNLILRDISVAVLLLNLSLSTAYSQNVVPHNEKVMFYNVENLFDTYDDSLTDDNDFLPDGLMRWNLKRYNKKINSLFKTIIAAGEWDPPALVGFCEIENRKVLEDLIYGTNLSKFNYSIIHEESPDRRGIDVCLIYRNKLADLISYKYWIPEELKKNDFNSRSVLYIKMAIGSDTLHFIVNHWPSRRGGVLAGEDKRQEVSSMVKIKVDSIFNYNAKSARIILLGDFNCTPEDQIIRSLTYSSDSDRVLINLSGSIKAKDSGTYRYMGRWEMIDQVIVSKGLLDCKKGLYTDANSVQILRADFLLKKDSKYPGFSPFSTYSGYKYQGGFSDHLPVILDLKVR
jgi:Endonuclease/Exonuclease/phosphatase family